MCCFTERSFEPLFEELLEITKKLGKSTVELYGIKERLALNSHSPKEQRKLIDALSDNTKKLLGYVNSDHSSLLLLNDLSIRLNRVQSGLNDISDLLPITEHYSQVSQHSHEYITRLARVIVKAHEEADPNAKIDRNLMLISQGIEQDLFKIHKVLERELQKLKECISYKDLEEVVSSTRASFEGKYPNFRPSEFLRSVSGDRKWGVVEGVDLLRKEITALKKQYPKEEEYLTAQLKLIDRSFLKSRTTIERLEGSLEKAVGTLKTIKEQENKAKSEALSERRVWKGTVPPPFEKAPVRQNLKFSTSELEEVTAMDDELEEVKDVDIQSVVGHEMTNSGLGNLLQVSPTLRDGTRGAKATSITTRETNKESASVQRASSIRRK